MSLRALYCGGVVKNGIVAWGNHIPVTHRETFLQFKFQLKGCKSAGFLGDEEGYLKIYGKGISLGIEANDFTNKRIRAGQDNYRFFRCMVTVGNYEFPLLFCGTYEPEFFELRKEITRDELGDALSQLEQLGCNYVSNDRRTVNWL